MNELLEIIEDLETLEVLHDGGGKDAGTAPRQLGSEEAPSMVLGRDVAGQLPTSRALHTQYQCLHAVPRVIHVE